MSGPTEEYKNRPFLPSTDLNQPHFLMDQVERHLDIGEYSERYSFLALV